MHLCWGSGTSEVDTARWQRNTAEHPARWQRSTAENPTADRHVNNEKANGSHSSRRQPEKTAKSAAPRFSAEDGSLENVGAVQLVIASVNSGSY